MSETIVLAGKRVPRAWLASAPLAEVMKVCRTEKQIEAVRLARGYSPKWTRIQLTLRQAARGGRT